MDSKKKYRLSKKGVVGDIYSGQKATSISRGHRPPEYTKKELSEWLFSQELFHVLYSEWVNSGYDRHVKPSVDRKYDDIHYCFNNIQLMTWKENNLKAHNDVMCGNTAKSNSKKVIQIILDGKFTTVHNSIAQASRYTGVSSSHICECCKGQRKSAGGFKWRYE